jgi:hypothetical protein
MQQAAAFSPVSTEQIQASFIVFLPQSPSNSFLPFLPAVILASTIIGTSIQATS